MKIFQTCLIFFCSLFFASLSYALDCWTLSEFSIESGPLENQQSVTATIRTANNTSRTCSYDMELRWYDPDDDRIETDEFDSCWDEPGASCSHYISLSGGSPRMPGQYRVRLDAREFLLNPTEINDWHTVTERTFTILDGEPDVGSITISNTTPNPGDTISVSTSVEEAAQYTGTWGDESSGGTFSPQTVSVNDDMPETNSHIATYVVPQLPGQTFDIEFEACNSTGCDSRGRAITIPSQYSLTTSSTAGGSVVTPGEGSFGPYNSSQGVTVTAQASTGYQFVNWTGSGVTAGKVANPNAISTTITMDGNYAVHANFSPITYNLTTASSSGGSVTAPGEGTFGPYNHGTPVPLTAEAATHYNFVNWTGTGVDAGKVANPNSAATTITVDNTYSVQANFTVAQYTLTTTSSQGGSINEPGEGSYGYDFNSQVSIVAASDPNYTFLSWSGSGVDAGKVANPNEASTTITMDSDYSVRANFESISRTLTTSSGTGGDVTTPGEGQFSYVHGSSATIAALADNGFTFANWTGSGVDAGKVTSPSNSNTTILMDGDYGVQANFQCEGTARLSLSSDSSEIGFGDTFIIDLNVTNVEELYGHELDVLFNPDHFEVIAVTEGDFLSQGGSASVFWQPSVIDNTSGSVRNIVSLRLTPGVGVTGTGVLAQIELQEKTGATDMYSSAVSLDQDEAKLSDPNATSICIQGFDDLSVSVVDGVAGDVDGDDDVDLTDALFALQAITGMTTSVPVNSSADVNDDQKIGIAEVIFILNNL